MMTICLCTDGVEVDDTSRRWSVRIGDRELFTICEGPADDDWLFRASVLVEDHELEHIELIEI